MESKQDLYAPQNLWDRIELQDLHIECLLGITKQERTRTQPIKIDLALYLNSRYAAKSGKLKDSVDYVRIIGQIRFLLESGQFELLETAAEAVAHYLLSPPTPAAPQAQIAAVELKFSKPQALKGLALPSLTVFRQMGETNLTVEEKVFGRIELIHTSNDCLIYRIILAPGQSLTIHSKEQAQENEMVLSSGLQLQGRNSTEGQVFRWPSDMQRRYENTTTQEQVILCVDRPMTTVEATEARKMSTALPWVDPAEYYAKTVSEYSNR